MSSEGTATSEEELFCVPKGFPPVGTSQPPLTAEEVIKNLSLGPDYLGNNCYVTFGHFSSSLYLSLLISNLGLIVNNTLNFRGWP